MKLSEIATAPPHLPGTQISVFPNSYSSHGALYPWVDAYRCNGCGACVRACPPDVIGLHKGKAAIVLDLCQQCGECFEACPVEGAVIFKLPPSSPQSGNTLYLAKV